MELNPDSLERRVPEQLSRDHTTGQEALRIGLERYAFASRHCRPGRLLDIACGVGYGTSLLTERVPQIDSALGIDLSEGAIAYARELLRRIASTLRHGFKNRYLTIARQAPA